MTPRRDAAGWDRQGYSASGRFMTARSCTIEHPKTHTRSVITVKEVAHDTGLGEDLFTVAHLSEDH